MDVPKLSSSARLVNKPWKRPNLVKLPRPPNPKPKTLKIWVTIGVGRKEWNEESTRLVIEVHRCLIEPSMFATRKLNRHCLKSVSSLLQFNPSKYSLSLTPLNLLSAWLLRKRRNSFSGPSLSVCVSVLDSEASKMQNFNFFFLFVWFSQQPIIMSTFISFLWFFPFTLSWFPSGKNKYF